MGRVMLSRSLIQFSVEGWGCVPSMLFDLRPNYDGGNEDNGNECYTQRPQPYSRPPPTPRLRQRLLDTHGQVWVSLLWGHCSFLLGLVHKVLCVPTQSLFPCPVEVLVALWWVNGDLLQEGLCRTQVTAPRAPASAAVCC